MCAITPATTNGAVTQSAVSLLREDPDLGSGLTETELADARDVLVAPAVTLAPGPWKGADANLRGGLAKATMLVLDGLLLSDTVLARCPSAELIGTGDVLSSPDRRAHPETLLPVDVELTVLEPTRVALLDERVQQASARWPPVAVARASAHPPKCRAFVRYRRVSDADR